MNVKQRMALFEADIESLENKNAIDEGNRDHILQTHRRYCLAGEFDLIDYFIPKNCVAIDVGANIGQYSIKLAGTCNRCISVEPVKSEWLKDSLKGKLPRNCDFFPVAAGESPGTATIRIPVVEGYAGKYEKYSSGNASFADFILQKYKEFVEQKTIIRTVDDIVSEIAPDAEIGFIKIDVEGYEVPAIKGALNVIKKWKPNLLVEIGDVRPTAKFIESHGYRGLFCEGNELFDISRYDPEIHRQGNFYFMPVGKLP